jgi:hypothetical protein
MQVRCLLKLTLLAILLCAGSALSGCVVGPDFKRPEAPKVDRYTETALPAETAAAAPRSDSLPAGTSRRNGGRCSNPRPSTN